METETRTVIIYDNLCSLCTAFARCACMLSRGRLRPVGHYSQEGEGAYRDALGADALKMFWIVSGGTAFGGRAALRPLLSEIARGAYRAPRNRDVVEPPDSGCGKSGCSGPKKAIARSASLILNSKKIAFGSQND